MDFDDENVTQNFSGPPSLRCGVPPALLPSIPAVVDYPYTAIVLIITLISILLNGIVVAKYKTLRQRSFVLSLQIVVLHFIFSSTVPIGAVVVNAIAREWLYIERGKVAN